jgi:2-polyprenyl-3-methyl-5-hydroxy-6-metoxy-1,4-benzoquinol methylase
LRDLWRESLLLPGFNDLRESALAELSAYFGVSREEALQRCVHWVDDSIAEWEAADRHSEDGLLEFYRTVQSWIYDTVWYHALQYSGEQPAESVIIAERFHHMAPGNHLDFGSGPGSTSLFFHRLGWNITLADISTTMLDFARWRLARHGTPATFYDLTSAQLPDQHFDLITACDVMVHVPDPEAPLSELQRALKPGGILVFNVHAMPMKTRDTQWHLYQYAYPVLRPARSCGFQRLPKLQFFHVYRKIEPRTPLRAQVVRLYDHCRYNLAVATMGRMVRAVQRR